MRRQHEYFDHPGEKGAQVVEELGSIPGKCKANVLILIYNPATQALRVVSSSAKKLVAAVRYAAGSMPRYCYTKTCSLLTRPLR